MVEKGWILSTHSPIIQLCPYIWFALIKLCANSKRTLKLGWREYDIIVVCAVIVSLGIHIFIGYWRSLGGQIWRKEGDRVGGGFMVFGHIPHPMGCKPLHYQPLGCSCFLWSRWRSRPTFHEYPSFRVTYLLLISSVKDTILLFHCNTHTFYFMVFHCESMFEKQY